MKYSKIIVWGARPETGHTHCFIHAAIVRACIFMGIPVFWLDNNHNLTDGFFDDALIITEQWLVFANGHSNRLPLRKSSCYLVHYLGNRGPVEGNPGASMYLGKVDKLIDFRFACNWGIDGVEDKNYAYKFEPEKYEKLNNGVSFYEKGKDFDNFYSIWGTDLLPNEINLDDRLKPWKQPQRYAFFGGTIRDDNKEVFDGFIRACSENNVIWLHNSPWTNPLPIPEIRKLVLESYMAPDFRPNNHTANGYISCRIMKNISYGRMGITNSKQTYDYFDRDVAYASDTYELFHVAEMYVYHKQALHRQMLNVQNNHTYVNRVKDFITASEM